MAGSDQTAVVKRLQWLVKKPYVGVVVELVGLVGGAELISLEHISLRDQGWRPI
jgi:hypothetical protein